MSKPKISLIFRIRIEMPDLSYIIELDCLKNFCSVNYSPKGLRVSNIDVNGNEKEILGDFGRL